MGPPGCKIIVHEKPGKRVLWSFTGLPGVYTGPFMNGYRTYKVYVPNTREDISVETVGIFSTINQNVLLVSNICHNKGSL